MEWSSASRVLAAAGVAIMPGLMLRGAGALRRLGEMSLDDVVPHVPAEMVESLKFSAALPEPTAVKTLSERFADRAGAQSVAREVGATAVDGPQHVP